MSEDHGPISPDVSSSILTGEIKATAYKKVRSYLSSLLTDITDPITKMATIASEFTEYFPRSQHFWTGFYRRIDNTNRLIVGPYQGTLGCMYIDYGKGVCGAVAQLEKTKIVSDTNHIIDPEIKNVIHCDGQTKSEIVVPIFGKGGLLIGVYDVDSTELDAFDEIDQQFLEAIMADHFSNTISLMHP